MIRRALYLIAGVDRETIATCPGTDRIWAAHLGFSLCLSFVVVLGIAFHATGYMIPDLATRVLVSLIIALTVFMFDRALYQSDWFYQGFISQPDASDGSTVRRFLRITVRLGMSFGLAWVIALFLELAIFSDTITERIKQEHAAANQSIFQKIEHYEADLAADLKRRREALAALEGLLRAELAAPLPAAPPPPREIAELEQQIRALDTQEAELRKELRSILESIKNYAVDMNAEQQGQKLSATSSGRAGAGPRYQFARQQKEVYEQQRAAQEAEIAQLRLKRDDLRTTQHRMAAETAARREEVLAAVKAKGDALQAQVVNGRAELNIRENERLARAAEFRQKTLASADVHNLRDDPLARMTAYQALKSDPKDGDTITLFSWMTKFLIIFLEIVPVVAKLFFSPPSAYSARIQAQVERERQRLAEAGPDPPVEQRMAEIAAQLRGTRPETAKVPLDMDIAAEVSTARRDNAAQPPHVELSLSREVAPEAAVERAAVSRTSEIEAARRRDLEQLIDEDTLRRALMRAGTAH